MAASLTRLALLLALAVSLAAAQTCAFFPGDRITFSGQFFSGFFDVGTGGNYNGTQTFSIPNQPKCEIDLAGVITASSDGKTFSQTSTCAPNPNDATCGALCPPSPQSGSVQWDADCKGGKLTVSSIVVDFKVNSLSAAVVASLALVLLLAASLLSM